MSLSLIVEKILQMESNLDLFNKKIDGVYFWELIRFNVMIEIAQKSKLYSQPHSVLKLNKKYFFNYLKKAAKNFFWKNPFFLQKSDIVFLGHPRRKLCDDGFWWDIYCDPVIDQIPRCYTKILLEHSYLNTHLVPQKTDCIAYLDLPLLIAVVFRKLRILRVSMSHRDLCLLSEIERFIKNDHCVDLDLKDLTYRILAHRKSILPVYKFILQKINPKIVVILVSYGNEAFVEACRSLHIPTVEFQHGTISEYHLGYSYIGSHASKRLFPDYFFAFGDYWKNLIKFPIEKNRIFSVGYPFFEEESKKYKDEIRKNQVIFISQGPVGEKLSRFAVDFQNVCSDYEIIYKLHPGEYSRWKEAYPWLVTASRIRIADDSEPLYRLLAQSKAQIGVSSTVLYEGLGMGLPTYLVDLPGVEYMDQLIVTKIVAKVLTVEDLVAALNSSKNKPIITEDFFKSNSLNNILVTLEKLLIDDCAHC